MTKKKPYPERNVEKIKREHAPIPWRYCALSLACAVIMVAGFFFAAKQHFSSVDYSMRNSDMRKAREKLEAQRLKLRVERVEVASPETIEKAGMKIGLKKFTSADFQFIDAAKNISPPENSKTVADMKSSTPAGSEKTGAAKEPKLVTARSVDALKKELSARITKTNISGAVVKEIPKMLIAKK